MTNQRGSGPDLIGDFQRWLMRAGARGMSRELADQVRTAIGRNQPSGDVWETATTEPQPGEAPECAWCPLCRAARLVREAKPGRDTRVAAVGDALTTVVQDAVSVLEAALAATSRATGPNGRREDAGPGTRGFPAAGQAAPASTGQAAPAESAGQAAPAESAGQAAPAESAGQAAPASTGHEAPAESAGQTGQAGQTVPEPSAGPDAGGPAAAAEEQAAPASPEEPPHEPDDRG